MTYRQIFFLVLCAGLMACGQEPGEPSQADQAIEELRSLYEKALEEAPDDPVEWAKEDISRYGDWEYRVVVIADNEPHTLEAEFNELGSERWEVFWMERSGGDLRLFLKRPSKSYLRSVPLSGLGNVLGSGESGN